MWSIVIEEVHRLARANALLLGESGEEHVRIAAAVAVDFAIKAQHGFRSMSSDDTTSWFMLSVHDWLSAFLGPDCADHKDIRDWAKRHWINFTHYFKCNEMFTKSKPMSHSYLTQAWLRQAAMISSITQPDWDLVMVALESEERPKLTDVLDISKLRPIAVQIKNRADHTPSKLKRLHNLTTRTLPLTATKHGSLSLYISLAAATASAEAKKDTSTKHRSIYVGCDAETPLWVFRGYQTSLAEASTQTVSLTVTAAREAQSLLGRWRNCYHNLASGDDGSMADFLAGTMYQESRSKFKIEADEANSSATDEMQHGKFSEFCNHHPYRSDVTAFSSFARRRCRRCIQKTIGRSAS